jgi:hypothetical protein
VLRQGLELTSKHYLDNNNNGVSTNTINNISSYANCAISSTPKSRTTALIDLKKEAIKTEKGANLRWISSSLLA